MADDTKSNKLNRELLRWIQSLDLAYSIKNVKRDFANGFLVAEILSRYYDKDISMHSYDNGIGMKVRKDNWDQLVKIFGRFADLELLTNKSDIDAIVHCQNGAAVAFLTKLYQCLTKRTIQPTAVAQLPTSGNVAAPISIAKSLDTVEEIPPYAKPTNSAFIRDKMREPEIAEMRDQTQLNRKVRDIHSQHEETQQLERLMTDTPDRYPAIRSANKATVLRGATKPVRNDDSNPVLMTQQVVREVQIKTINQKGLEKLRATREAKENESLGFSGSSCLLGEARGVASFDTRGMNGGSSSPELIQKRRPLDLLNEAVARKLSSLALTLKPRGGKDKFENFLDNVYEGNVFGEHECAAVLQGIEEEVEVLALAFLDFPREFWKFQVFYEHKNSTSADPDALMVMLKCFEQLSHTEQQLNVRMLYDQMKGYVVLGFASASTCELSANIVKVTLTALDGSETDVFQHVALVEALQNLVTRDVEDIRQQTVVKMLHDAHVLSPVWAERVLHCVNNLRSKCDADTFKSSLFSIAFEI
ncbi:hypothetical protein JG688_00003578 [Phytophthora aleatoria]|uniref:Spermatogenesis-associated protein 4 n=1 Tax=Phytophthora aleatoria TaxID=2496075 RepID=A0A8J5JB71_9STRA|nr:hypothetical protein JG688_00003578 [Phytophthora aleatoria]